MEDVCCQILYFWFILYPLSLVYTAPWWTARAHDDACQTRKKITARTGHFVTAAILKFIEIDWFLQIIVKLILPLNIETKRSWEGRPQHQNRRLMAVKMFRDQYYQLKNKCTRALKSACNKTAVKTGQFFFFWLFNTFCYKQVYDNHWYKVSIILNNIPNENKQTSSFKCDLLQIKDPLKTWEKINNI